MSAEAGVLADEQIVSIARALGWAVKYDEIRENAVEISRAIEKVFLQSDEVQAWKLDAERWKRSLQERKE